MAPDRTERTRYFRVSDLGAGLGYGLHFAADYSEIRTDPPLFARKQLKKYSLTAIAAIALVAISAGYADEVQLRSDHPERYTVKKGDTLWDIATHFLKSPWYWPKIWTINQQIANPHLIYPGDVIVLRFVDGKPELTVLRAEKPDEAMVEAPVYGEPPPAVVTAPPPEGTVKLKPKVRVESLTRPIPTLSPAVIGPFLSKPLAVDENELARSGYITIGVDDRIALGTNSQFYARGFRPADKDQEFFYIYRQGNPIVDPKTGETLAYEAIYLGDAQRIESGDTARMVVVSAKKEIGPTDRLLPAPKNPPLPYYFPAAPDKQVKGQILNSLDTVAEIGPLMIVAINLGTRDGVREGTVLRVSRHVGELIDPVTREPYTPPEEASGIMMVFRPYERISYALIMTATQPIHLLDTVSTP